MKNGQKSSLYGETSLYSEEISYSELFSKIHYIEYPLYLYLIVLDTYNVVFPNSIFSRPLYNSRSALKLFFLYLSQYIINTLPSQINV